MNLDETEVADYAYMAEGGFSVLYEGTAAGAGPTSNGRCFTSNWRLTPPFEEKS